ncbi:hypothetical protein [Paractinoplanes toevensis]|uniref:Uncharacterized protein n=1 Tax=Paractinoplanes toevensis TaxID=571911 RepID=A0A919W051_9ACTN|nr:hypothetical protein [Actinoplanes toevensis]GIM88789.1 hypothetical protein Ato02nite_005820 [Actinoplanes toevensis]
MSDSEKRRLFLIENIYDKDVEDPGEAIDTMSLFEEPPDEKAQALYWGSLRTLDREGLIYLHSGLSFDGQSVVITEDGRSFVERLRAMRRDPAQQRRAAQLGLLQWLNGEEPQGERYLNVEEAANAVLFEYARLPVERFWEAAAALKRLGLVEATAPVVENGNLPMKAKITDEGRDLVNSGKSMEDYVREQRQPRNQVSIGTMSGGNFAFDAANFSQSSAGNTGSSADEIAVLLQAFAEALPVLGLSASQQEEAGRDLETLQAEVQRANPNKSFVKARLTETVDTVLGAGNSMLGLVLRAYAMKAFADWGVPIEAPAE